MYPPVDRYVDLVFRARLTGRDDTQKPPRYSWVEQTVNNDGSLTDAAAPRSGSFTSAWAVEVNGLALDVGSGSTSTTSPGPNPVYVWLKFRCAVDGFPTYDFLWPLPPPSLAKVTSTSPDADGNFPAILQRWSQAGAAWMSGPAVKVKLANGNTPTANSYYVVVFQSIKADGTQIWATGLAVALSCVTKTVVVDVACVGGNIVVTTDTISYLACPVGS